MIPTEFSNFFLGGLAAGGALIGLLFVAISIAPDRTVTQVAPPERHATAASAFGALADPFFISLVALIPRWNVGWGILFFAALGLANTLAQSRLLFTWHATWGRASLGRRLSLLAPGAIIYVVQLGIAWRLLALPHDDLAVYLLALSLVAMYLVGIIRSWELVGAGPTGLLSRLDRSHEPADPAEPSAPTPRRASATREPAIKRPDGASDQ
jgi:hypothetical protein